MKILYFIVLIVLVSAKVGYFWQISDPHFDSNYKEGGDKENCNYEIVCCRHIFPNTTKKAGKFGAPDGMNCNSPLVTIKSTFNFIKTLTARLNPKPSFLLMTGDYAGHDIELQTKEGNLQKIKEFTDFTEDMNSGMKIYPSFGNHDGFPCDTLNDKQPNDMLNQLSRIWSKHRLTPESINNIRKGGYYTERIMPGLRVINMNTQWSSMLNAYLLVDSSKDHANHMKFIKDSLELAARNNEKVIILGHIRPRGDSTRWFPSKLLEFEELIQKHHQRIIGQFYGHTHTDSISFMMNKDNKIINPMFVGGVIVTKTKKHPTVRLYKYNADDFKLLDYEDFYIPLKESEAIGEIIWKSLYKFTEEYNLPDLSNESFEKLYESFKISDVNWKKYLWNYRSRYTNKVCQGNCKKTELCKMISPTQQRLMECLKR
eukprot:gene6734-10899_t